MLKRVRAQREADANLVIWAITIGFLVYVITWNYAVTFGIR